MVNKKSLSHYPQLQVCALEQAATNNADSIRNTVNPTFFILYFPNYTANLRHSFHTCKTIARKWRCRKEILHIIL